VPEKPAISIDKLAQMLLGAEANAAEALEQQMLSRLDEQTFVGGKHVARQQLPDLPEPAETTVHRVKVSLLDLADQLAGHPAWAMRASTTPAAQGSFGRTGPSWSSRRWRSPKSVTCSPVLGHARPGK